jgi:glycerol-3-phosphate dehydrogenase
LIKIAPHLARPLPLLTPCYSWWEGFYYNIGLKIYDLLAGKTNLAPSDWLSKTDTLHRIPQLNSEKLHSSVLYFDGQFDDARFVMALAKTATQQGATVLNHMLIDAFEKDTNGKLSAVKLKDTLKDEDYTIRAKIFINATGPFADSIRLLANPSVGKRMRVSKGVHLILPRELMVLDTAVLIPKTDDGRVIFIIPYLNYLMVGTTDEECNLTENEIRLEKNDVAYLLKYVNRYLKTPVTPEQVKAGFGGLRPLLQADPTADTKSLVRDHEVEIDKQSGLISIMGGKWTTYRVMAKDTIDKTEEILRGYVSPCKTDEQLLSGAEGWSPDYFKTLMKKYGLFEHVARRLSHKYGTDSERLLSILHKDPFLKQFIAPQTNILKAEVIYAATDEMAFTLKDIMARRLGLEILDWKGSVESTRAVAGLMQEALWFPLEEKDRMIEEYLNEMNSIQETAGLLERKEVEKSAGQL